MGGLIILIVLVIFTVAAFSAEAYVLGVVFLLALGGFIAIFVSTIKEEKAKEKAKKEKFKSLEGEEKKDFFLKEYLGVDIDEIKRKATCPACGAKSEWDLFKTEEREEEIPDKALRIGGATTVFYDKKIKYKKHYKCRKCGFIKVEEE
ncbi:MAG: hypothetical protein IKA61_03350 [Clostridia bacterium]|nr:hypothetical protein [Clostridia bacterium]